MVAINSRGQRVKMGVLFVRDRKRAFSIVELVRLLTPNIKNTGVRTPENCDGEDLI